MRRYHWLVVLLLGIILGISFIYMGLIRPVVELVNRTPPPLPTYSLYTVREVCDLLRLDANDPFCLEPRDQNPATFEEMLKRNFPIGETKFDDLMTLLAHLPARAQGTAFEGADFEPNGCQTFLEDKYECSLIFPGEINMVRIRFASASRVIIDYGVTKPGS